ncbi:MAG: hypothetical protein GX072_05820 [Lysinibacillus sp.]|nr:hypothetical protein [Lysinibacillus sp.]
MQFGVWIGIIVSAIVAFLVASFFHQPLHWYLFILILFIGSLIQLIIMIIKTPDENE